MTANIFEFKDYKKYLNQTLKASSGKSRGGRSRLAKALACQPGYISRVLNGDIHLSLEQADAANRHLAHGDEEARYFLLLVQHARAGTPQLREFLGRQITQIQETQFDLKNRLKIDAALKPEDQVVYFSQWYYAAVHALIALPKGHDQDWLAARLQLPKRKINETLQTLIRLGLIEEKDGRYHAGTRRLHLGTNSPMLPKHHINWRMKSIQSLERSEPTDLHYSSVVTLAEGDYLRLRSELIRFIEQAKNLVKDSKDETAASFCIDLFTV